MTHPETTTAKSVKIHIFSTLDAIIDLKNRLVNCLITLCDISAYFIWFTLICLMGTGDGYTWKIVSFLLLVQPKSVMAFLMALMRTCSRLYRKDLLHVAQLIIATKIIKRIYQLTMKKKSEIWEQRNRSSTEYDCSFLLNLNEWFDRKMWNEFCQLCN